MYWPKNSFLLLILAINASSCLALPFMSWLGFESVPAMPADQIDRKYTKSYTTRVKNHILEHTLGKKEKKAPSHRDQQDFDTYYVKIPGPQDNPGVYDHSEGVGVWELPPIWDGRLEVPNLIPKNTKKDGHIQYGGDIIPDERIVKGWDNRWGLRVAIPYLGDFQYLREIGPGDFVPKLGPGKFYYPGPGEVDDYGHKAYDPNEGYERPIPKVPVVDLTEYEGLRNYGW